MKKVLLFLSQGFEEVEASAFIDICGWTKIVKNVQPIELTTAGLHNEIKATHNLIVKPQKLLNEIAPAEFDAFALPGGFHARGFEEAYNDEVLDVIRKIYEKGGIIAGICTGALPIAKSGILKGKQATTYPLYPEVTDRDNRSILKSYGAVVVTNQDIVVHDRIITSSGPSTCFKVAFKMLELLIGLEDTEKVKRAMQFKEGKEW